MLVAIGNEPGGPLAQREPGGRDAAGSDAGWCHAPTGAAGSANAGMYRVIAASLALWRSDGSSMTPSYAAATTIIAIPH
jgi:hypothetical protein